MDLELNGSIAVVTGGGSGIGKEVSRVLSQEGCTVVICARRMGPLEDSAREISAETGREVVPLYCDTNEMTAVSDMVDAVISRWCGTISNMPVTTSCWPI